ncbi:hypothetical protein RCL1_001516 [Eukaryota sp. TZLM3-RCL]
MKVYCRYFNSPSGCRDGSNVCYLTTSNSSYCKFAHEAPTSSSSKQLFTRWFCPSDWIIQKSSKKLVFPSLTISSGANLKIKDILLRGKSLCSAVVFLPKDTRSVYLTFRRNGQHVINPYYPTTTNSKGMVVNCSNISDFEKPLYCLLDYEARTLKKDGMILKQVEFYFSEAWLHDECQLRSVMADNNGYVPLETMCKTDRVKQIMPKINAEKLGQILSRSSLLRLHPEYGVTAVNVPNITKKELHERTISVFPLTKREECIEVVRHIEATFYPFYQGENYAPLDFVTKWERGTYHCHITMRSRTNALTIAAQQVITVGTRQYLVRPRWFSKNSSSGKECEFCFERCEEDWQQRISLNCDHERSVCKDCMKQWIDVKIVVEGTAKLTCYSCSAEMEASDVQGFTDSVVYQRLCERKTIASLEAKPHFFWCPNVNCTNGFVEEEGGEFKCVSCGQHCCTKSSHPHPKAAPMHDGMTCAQYESSLQREFAQNSQWLLENTKPCPSCKTRIQKDGGCLHMNCQQCRHDFWWCCANRYDTSKPRANHGDSCPNTGHFS